jgi:tetratricopeptide (TPR) repeat protein
VKKNQNKNRPSEKTSTVQSQLAGTNYTSNPLINALGVVLLILVGVVIYSNSFNCTFHFDDYPNIVDNNNIPAWNDFAAWWSFNKSRLIPYYSFALNIHFNQYDVWGYHLVNLIIHLINACLVWWLTRLIFSAPAIKNLAIAKYKDELAFITALFFVTHPLATQSVTYIVQRMASMTAMFYLLSVAAYMKARLIETSVAKYLLFAVCFLSAILALLTKENAFTLPIALVLVEFFLLRTKITGINFRDYRLLVLVIAVIGVVVFAVMKYSGSMFKSILPNEVHDETLTPINYLFTQFRVIAEYIRLLIIPVNQMVDHDIPISNSFFEIGTLMPFLLHAGLIVFAIFLFNRNRLISFGIFWFYLTLAIESSIIPINDVMFEHRTYLPSVGFFLILTSVLYTALRENYKMLAFAVITIIAAAYAVLTYQRNKIWKDDLTLWNDNVKKAPGLARPWNNRGYAYWNREQWEKAMADYTKALERNPRYPLALSNRGVGFSHFKQWDKAVMDYTRALEIDSNFTKAYSNRGVAFQNLKQWDKALIDYTKAIRVNPNYAKAYSNRGVAYENLKQWELAIADHSKALELDPDYKLAYYNRAVAYDNLKQWDQSIADYSRAIEYNPNHKEAYIRRGNAYGEKGMWDKAIADYDKVIAMDPDFAIAYKFKEVAVENMRKKK